MPELCEISILDGPAMDRALTRMAHEIAERNPASRQVVLIGVQRGGIHLAHRLGKRLEQIWSHPVPVGRLDINMHRDDIHQQLAPEVHPTEIPCDIHDKTVVLVDDVLFSGRTTRAGLDALIDLGRPQRIQLAVLVDRGHRELPIKADFVGKNVPTASHEQIDVRFKEDGGEDHVYLIRR